MNSKTISIANETGEMDSNIKQAGFTLIEVLVMTVLLALAFSVFRFFKYGERFAK